MATTGSGTSTAGDEVAANATNATRSRFKRSFDWAFGYPRLTVGLLLLLTVLVLSLGAPLFTNVGPLEQHLKTVLSPPDSQFLLGSDQLGRDVWSRGLYGGRLVLAVALVSTALAVTTGVFLGLLSGYLGGAVDAVTIRLMDGVIVFPELVLALAITYALGPSFWTVSAAIAVVNVPRFARVVRGQVLSLREREFVSAAIVAGASTGRILRLHLLPNVLEVTIVQAALTGGSAIFTAARLISRTLFERPCFSRRIAFAPNVFVSITVAPART